MNKPIIFLGKSGCGKSTLLNYLTSNFKYDKAISHTTRPARDNEMDGKDYFFVTNEIFNTLLKEEKLFEYTYYNNYLYGLSKNELAKNNCISILNPVGLRALKRQNIDCLSFYITAFDKTRYIRQLNRGDLIIDIALRNERDTVAFEGLEFDVDYMIDNSFEEEAALEDILRIIAHEDSK